MGFFFHGARLPNFTPCFTGTVLACMETFHADFIHASQCHESIRYRTKRSYNKNKPGSLSLSLSLSVCVCVCVCVCRSVSYMNLLKNHIFPHL